MFEEEQIVILHVYVWNLEYMEDKVFNIDIDKGK